MATSINSAQDLAPVYSVDPAKSRFQVKATASGMLSSFGHNPVIAIRRFTGEARFHAQAPERSSLRIEIDATSLAIAGDVNEKDRIEMDRAMKEDVLEIDRYPAIRFEGSDTQAIKITEGMYRVALAGKLSLHGVEKNVEFPCNVTAAEDNLRANGEFSIRQTDYQIKLVSVAGGALKLKDELKFTFDIVAHRKREAANA
jgi:polyisoprenoid-binding protein YceI